MQDKLNIGKKDLTWRYITLRPDTITRTHLSKGLMLALIISLHKLELSGKTGLWSCM